MTLTALNNDPSTTLTFGRMTLATLAAWSAAPQASGGAALNVTWFADTPMVYYNGSFQIVPLQFRLRLSGTWAACTITVKSMSKGDETISVAAAFTGDKLTTQTFLRSDVQAIISNINPGATAKLDIEWVFPAGVKACASGAVVADLAGICLTNTNLAPRTWGRIGQPGDNVAIELEAGAVVSIGTPLFLLASGKARDKRAGDTSGVDLGNCKAALIVRGAITYAPFTFAPTDI